MADIREQIKRKYGVDIETLNLVSLVLNVTKIAI